MKVCFEIATLFHSAMRRGKKGGNFKINIHLISVESFLYCLCSRKLWLLPTYAWMSCHDQKVTVYWGRIVPKTSWAAKQCIFKRSTCEPCEREQGARKTIVQSPPPFVCILVQLLQLKRRRKRMMIWQKSWYGLNDF